MSNGERVTFIYAGMGCAIFGGPFFEQKIDFGGGNSRQVIIIFGMSF